MSHVPELRILSDPDAVAREAARLLVDILAEAARGETPVSIALCGGRTPAAILRRLADDPELPRELLDVYWGDERCVPRDHPDSNFRLAREAFLVPAGIPQERVHPVRTDLPPLEAASDYEALLRRKAPGGLTTALLGLGADGHTASLFPGSLALDDRAWTAATTAPDGGARVTLTPAYFERCGRLVLAAHGEEKAGAVQAAFGAASELIPARRLSPARGWVWVLDRAAASLLPRTVFKG